MVSRAEGDFHTAAEATLSGYLAVAADAMRDVMEIENLLLDFAVEPAHIVEWLTATAQQRWKRFRPAVVRKRLHAAREGSFATTAESVDYRAHSAALHVSPFQDPIASRGFSAEQGWGGDVGYWEMFEHFRRFMNAVQRIVGTAAAETALHELTHKELSDVKDAWQRTQEMQTIFIALLEATAAVQADSGDSD